MPRPMPPYTAAFQRGVTYALGLARAGEAAAHSSARSEWQTTRVEYLYELSFLRIFVEWEIFLEQTFLRYLCGYQSTHGTFAPTAGRHCVSLAHAERLIFRQRGFALWHDPAAVVNRSLQHLISCPHEVIVQSNSARLLHFAAIRHRVVHGQVDAKLKFDNATMTISGRRYHASRPGRFLRDWDISAVQASRWLEVVGLELVGMARQIA